MHKLYAMLEGDESCGKNRGAGLRSWFDSIVNKGVRLGTLKSHLSKALRGQLTEL